VISSKLLGTREWFVIHHTNCGMETFTDQVMRRLLASSLQTASFDGKQWSDPGTGAGSSEGEYIDWLTITGQHESVVADVRQLRNHPLVPVEIPIYGLIYDVQSGKLLEVPEAMAIGVPMQQAWSRAA
jgi:carbonic anhydrase